MTRHVVRLAAFLALLLLRPVASVANAPAPDDAWDDRFHGGLGSPSFLQAAPDGAILAVGNMDPPGPVGLGRGVLRWHRDSGWETAAGPLGGTLRAAAVFRGEIHVGGVNLSAEGVSLPGHVAVWRNSQWTHLAGGVTGVVFAMTPHNDRLYVGGSLSAVGDVVVQNVACWDGEAWSAVGDGVPFRVQAMTVFQDRLVVAGDAASPNAKGGILQWNGTSWQPLGEGVSGTTAATGIRAVLSLGDSLYVGGTFATAGLQAARNVARWDGALWHPMGDGPGGAAVSALAAMGNHVAAGAAELSIWDGNSWNVHAAADLTSLVNGISLASSGSDLMALGFSLNPIAGGFRTVVLVRGDSVEIQGLGSRTLGVPEMNAFAASATGIVVGGAFRSDNVALSECLARWDGRTWKSLDRGLNYPLTGLRVRVLGVATSNDEIVAGGLFPRVGTNEVNNITRWDGTRWLPLGEGIPDSAVNAVAWLGDKIIAATDSAGVLVWDGQAWHSLGVPRPLRYHALAVSGNEVFAAGSLGSVTVPTSGVIARWDGKAWTELATNLPSRVCLYHDGRRLYAGGRFTEIQGVRARGIAAWDGTRWAAGSLDDDPVPGLVDEVRAITGDGSGRLFVGGTFAHEGSGATNVAWIEGDTWHALGSGVSLSPVTALAWWNGGLLVGGTFHQAGGKESLAVALWHDAISSHELDLHAPHSVARDATLDVRLLVRRVPGLDLPSATVRLVIPSDATFVSADHGGTESSGVITWTLDGDGEGGGTSNSNLVVECRLRASAAASLLVFDDASVEAPGQPRFRARPHTTTVVAPGAPPRVRLSQPASSPVVARAPIVLEAEIEPGTTSPASVEFFAGMTKVGAATAAPWRIEWNAPVAGTTVFRAMLVDSTGQTITSVPVSIELRSPPVNDNFADRIPLDPFTRERFTSGNVVVADPFGATVESGEPEHGPGIPAQRSLWWSLLPPADGRLAFALPQEGLRVRVYTGSDLANLTPVGFASMDSTIAVQKDVSYSIAADYADGLDATAWTYHYQPAGGRIFQVLVVLPDLLEVVFESSETREYTLEGSTNLVDWEPMIPFEAPQGWHSILVPRAAEPVNQFYRVR